MFRRFIKNRIWFWVLRVMVRERRKGYGSFLVFWLLEGELVSGIRLDNVVRG